VITHHIKWFLCLSVAAHALVLSAWHMPAYTPGKSGHTVLLSVTQRAGDRIEQSQTATVPVTDALTDTTAPPVHTEAPATRVASNRVITRDSTSRQTNSTANPASSAASPPMTTSSAAAAASNPSIQREETDRQLRSSVMELITRKLTYPAIARRKGWQGTVKLQLHIEADGAITRLQVDETSGYRILDRAAMECLQLASLPGAARWLHGQAIDIVVPVEYRLVDS